MDLFLMLLKKKSKLCRTISGCDAWERHCTVPINFTNIPQGGNSVFCLLLVMLLSFSIFEMRQTPEQYKQMYEGVYPDINYSPKTGTGHCGTAPGCQGTSTSPYQGSYWSSSISTTTCHCSTTTQAEKSCVRAPCTPPSGTAIKFRRYFYITKHQRSPPNLLPVRCFWGNYESYSL